MAKRIGVSRHFVVDFDLRQFGGSALTSDTAVPKERSATVRANGESGHEGGVEGTQRLKIHTPLINLTKAQIIKKGLDLGVDFAITSNCYDPGPAGMPCGACDSCQLRAKGFTEIGVTDPLLVKFGMT